MGKPCSDRSPDRYSRQGDMRPKVTDSVVWKRLCDINSIATDLCSYNEDGEIFWDPGINGFFSLKSAYNEIRSSRSSTFSDKHVWHKYEHMTVKLFMWKLLNGYLPLLGNLQKLHFYLQPSSFFC
ncbi:unnamed protein product [Cuscuta europaea]|uniref:Reverse transcriptase zinc-binding domain-containing protein n=1 Tax=Cuscuta europaea TaxID=41803 RepID=A0A9P1E6R1_CUSEU|nr:unnamed protein product [Cuscuta europaea]